MHLPYIILICSLHPITSPAVLHLPAFINGRFGATILPSGMVRSLTQVRILVHFWEEVVSVTGLDDVGVTVGGMEVGTRWVV